MENIKENISRIELTYFEAIAERQIDFGKPEKSTKEGAKSSSVGSLEAFLIGLS